MKLYCYLLFCCTFLILSLEAQQGEFTNCRYAYFVQSKKISTSTCFNSENTWGESKAFNKNGTEIYRRKIRTVAGHATVQFKYFASGAVQEAFFSSAPDAGIQWYYETIRFNEEGKIIEERKESNEDLLTTNTHQLITEKPIKNLPQENNDKDLTKNAKCAETYANEIWIYNKSVKPVTIAAIPHKKGTVHNSISLKAGEKKRLTIFGNAYSEQIPEDYFNLKLIKRTKSKNKSANIPLKINFKSKIQSPNLSQFEYWIE